MKTIEIKNRFTGEVIISGKYESVKDCLEKNKDKSLNGANLDGANLVGANLYGAELPYTDIVLNDRYHIHIRPDYIKIGCEQHPVSWFKKMSIKSAEKLYNAGEWWKYWKPIVLAIYDVIKDRK